MKKIGNKEQAEIALARSKFLDRLPIARKKTIKKWEIDKYLKIINKRP